jgi:hypothetical protein
MNLVMSLMLATLSLNVDGWNLTSWIGTSPKSSVSLTESVVPRKSVLRKDYTGEENYRRRRSYCDSVQP